MVDQWEQFDRDMSTLESWLTQAHNTVSTLSGITERDSRSIAALRNKMDDFLVSILH